MASVNKVILLGNLGKDPEMRYTPGGEAVASFSLATTERWKDKGGSPQERTNWHRITAWGRLAEIAQEFLKKGAPVYIEGRIDYREFTDKEGVKKWSTDIIAERLQLLGKREEGRGSSEDSRSSSEAKAPANKTADFADDDIPF